MQLGLQFHVSVAQGYSMLLAVAMQWSCIIKRSTKEEREPRMTTNGIVAAGAVAVAVAAYQSGVVLGGLFYICCVFAIRECIVVTLIYIWCHVGSNLGVHLAAPMNCIAAHCSWGCCASQMQAGQGRNVAAHSSLTAPFCITCGNLPCRTLSTSISLLLCSPGL